MDTNNEGGGEMPAPDAAGQPAGGRAVTAHPPGQADRRVATIPPEGDGAASVEETELVRRAQAADPWAVDQLIRRYQKKVYAIAYQVCGFDAEEARDSAQEALLQVFRHIDRFEGRSRFSTWVHRVAVNTCLDAKRRRRRWLRMILPRRPDPGDAEPENELENMPAPEEGSDPVTAISGSELKRDVTAALGRLSEHQRNIFQLKVFQEMSIPEIAEITGMAEGTVKSHLFRATRSVREQLHAWARRDGKGGVP
jgi:RNA polymerase sigma-70 factor, ECF subfamily